jgi:hypothetical protein
MALALVHLLAGVVATLALSTSLSASELKAVRADLARWRKPEDFARAVEQLVVRISSPELFNVPQRLPT